MNDKTIPADLQWLYDKAIWGNAQISYTTRKHEPRIGEIAPTLVGLIERIAKLEAR